MLTPTIDRNGIYHRSMPKFSIKDLMFATAMVAVGLSCSVYVINTNDARGFSSGHIAFLIGLYFVGWNIAGCGLAYTFRQTRLGLFSGLLIAMVLGFGLLVFWRFQDNSVMWWLHVKRIHL